MLKIIYASSKNVNSKIQLIRFIEAIKDAPINLKIAAYKDFSPNINIDWTLDALLNFLRPNQINFDNDNFKIYYDQIKYFNPDIVISDLEPFTSYAANMLDITLWQCSSSIINFALSKKEKYNLGLFKNYSFIFNRDPQSVQKTINILDNSNCNLLYSHFGDLESPPDVDSGYEWITPYHNIGKNSLTCSHNMVAVTATLNKKLIHKIKKYNDVVLFSEYTDEYYDDLLVKNIYDLQEYFCNIKNSNNIICDGNTSFLADAFYNNKKPMVYLNHNNHEAILNSLISKKLNLSTYFSNKEVDLSINTSKKNKYLHEKILDYIQ